MLFIHVTRGVATFFEGGCPENCGLLKSDICGLMYARSTFATYVFIEESHFKFLYISFFSDYIHNLHTWIASLYDIYFKNAIYNHYEWLSTWPTAIPIFQGAFLWGLGGMPPITFWFLGALWWLLLTWLWTQQSSIYEIFREKYRIYCH